MGYSPDIDANFTGFNGADSLTNIIDKGTTLSPANGYEAIAATVEDLGGGNDYTFNFPLGDDDLGAFEAPAAAGNAQPINCMGAVVWQISLAGGGTPSTTSPGDTLTTFYVTAPKTAAPEVGHFVTIDGANHMIEVPAAGGVTAISGLRDAVFDWTFTEWGGTKVSLQSPGTVIFTNNVDEVYMWDPENGGTYPGRYLNLTSSSPVDPLIAQSVATFAGRLNFFNVSMAGNRHFNRLLWTSIREDLTGTVFENVGWGFMDFDELREQGLRCLPIGNSLACYARDGVVIVSRTGLPSSPYHKSYRTRDRGLLGPHAVTVVGNGVHLGLFTDGWWLLFENGQWQELGDIGIGGVPYNKWKADFLDNQYDSLRSDRIVLAWDRNNDYVHVSFPNPGVSDNNQVWMYNKKTDAIWPQTYEATYWGYFANLLQAGVVIDDLSVPPHPAPGTIGGAYPGRTIGSFAPQVGYRSLAHGDSAGFAYQHSTQFSSRDGAEPFYSYGSHFTPGGRPGQEHTIERVLVEYERDPNNAGDITVSIGTDDPTDAIAADNAQVETGLGVHVAHSDHDFLGSQTHHRVILEGQHPRKIRSFTLRGYTEDDLSVKRDPS